MPPEITISLEEYDKIKSEVSKLLDYHQMIRRAFWAFSGIEMSDEEKAELQQQFHHFNREYPLDV